MFLKLGFSSAKNLKKKDYDTMMNGVPEIFKKISDNTREITYIQFKKFSLFWIFSIKIKIDSFDEFFWPGSF